MTSPQIAITGIGIVSPFGIGRERFWEAVSAGRSGVRRIASFDPSAYACQIAAEVPPIDPELVPARAGYGKRSSRAALIGMLAAQQAWADAGLGAGDRRAGVVIGSGGGGIDLAEQQYGEFFRDSLKKVTPWAIPLSVVGMMSSEISIGLGLRGMSHVLSCGCTSSTDAIGYAAGIIRAGEADAIVTGGTDACVTAGMIAGFSKMKAVTPSFNEEPWRGSRPFNRDRDGFVLGEGAWMFVVERLDRARARGAAAYAVVAGYGSTCDAFHPVQMNPDAREIVRAMALAIERAGLEPAAIDYINLHGTSTPLNDLVETRAVRALYGATPPPPASATKSMIGHPQGASGAAGVAATALALAHSFLPPTINYEHPDPECDLDYVPNAGRPAAIRTALCNCLGFGSKNSALVLTRADG